MSSPNVSFDTNDPDPTSITYDSFTDAYDLLNERLFDGRLPHCLITMQRKHGAFGYFSGDRFGTQDGSEITDEIALNPSHFKSRTTEQSLSTLAHEMCHLEQHHFGSPSRGGYHNKEWGAMMKAIGLMPSDTAAPGGKETGQRVSHYIAPDGPFATVCAEMIEEGFELHYVELGNPKTRKAKAASKTKYTCLKCGLNAWGKPAIHLTCDDCKELMTELKNWYVLS